MIQLNILLLEDSPLDAELTLSALDDPEFRLHVIRAETGEEFEAAIAAGGLDLILADYALPAFDGLSALEIARVRCPDVPFIFVSGTLGEEVAIESLKRGATDYVLKQRLQRLLPAVKRAARELAERRSRRRAEEALRAGEERFRLLVDGVRDYAIVMLDARACIESWNDGAARLHGFSAEEVIGQPFTVLFPEETRATEPARQLREARECGRSEQEGRRARRDGSHFLANGVVTSIREPDGRLSGYASVTCDITERKSLESALHQRAAELAAADKRKDEFLAMLAHELRNPLAPILNAVQLMRARGSDDPTLRQAREVVERQARHMGRLLDDLLDISRITRGEIQLRREATLLSRLVEDASQTSRPLIEAHGHQLAFRLPAEPIWLNVDVTRLTQVLSNLLNNAAKYTPDGGEIALEAALDGDDVQIVVRDSGRGIPPEMLASVFDLFVQVNPSIDRAQGGLGLGLTLVKRILDLHGGSVEARSSGVGKGSEFVVRLPTVRRRIPHGARSPGAHGRAVAQRRRVLVVDDNVDAAETLGELLEVWGHEVRVVYDGIAAVEAVDDEAPDVVLLDIGLPGRDGYSVARQLRGEAGLPHLLLIAITGYGQETDRQLSVEAGFDHHFTKPVDLEQLQRILDQEAADLSATGNAAPTFTAPRPRH